MMIYIKSLVAGLVAVLIVSGLSLLILTVYGFWTIRGAEHVTIVLFPVAWLRSSAFTWMIFLGAFLIGSLWQFRRLAQKSSTSAR